MMSPFFKEAYLTVRVRISQVYMKRSKNLKHSESNDQ
jgi:hypothetical protein